MYLSIRKKLKYIIWRLELLQAEDKHLDVRCLLDDCRLLYSDVDRHVAHMDELAIFHDLLDEIIEGKSLSSEFRSNDLLTQKTTTYRLKVEEIQKIEE